MHCYANHVVISIATSHLGCQNDIILCKFKLTQSYTIISTKL